jgi:choline dehydrogenase
LHVYSKNEKVKNKYDYIIVGGGSAGCVLADRLSEDPAHSVLLLEAGGRDNKMFVKIPAAYGNLHRSEMDWGFNTEPQPHVNNRRIYLPRGKVLGGSSSTNAMAYVRGNSADYDEWASLGNSGWSYRDVLPYFIKSEHNEDIRNAYHGQEGPLHVSFAKHFKTPFAKAFIQGCIEALQIPENHDYNGKNQEGAGLFQFNIKAGKRHSAADAFLKPAIKRKNLHILIGAMATQIAIKNDRAEGVQWIDTKTKQKHTAIANREVLICSGSFQSPQLLMLSGLGEKDLLKKHGITCKKELPGVGQNLQDHLFYFLSATSPIASGFNHRLKPHIKIKDLLQWLITNKGPLTISPLEAVAFFRVMDSERVNMQFHFTPLHVGPPGNPKVDVYNADSYPTGPDGYTILPSLLKPYSRGYVGLRSGNPADAPIIQPRFLSDDRDMQALVEGGRAALEVMKSKALAPYSDRIIAPIDNSESALEDHIRQTLETIYHPVGTCKMGKDDMAVVNDQLQVHGIENLRVVDASIMPVIVAGNTNAPVYMIAEKAADMILNSR